MDYESLNSVTGLSELVVMLVALITREVVGYVLRRKR